MTSKDDITKINMRLSTMYERICDDNSKIQFDALIHRIEFDLDIVERVMGRD